mmetsp:Transcript_1676/g.6326  ORF Transcript_1676/g.6326 Transcript_1676/m.6326 type:complete len:490 (+) Transcript_1676:409-1878(+)
MLRLELEPPVEPVEPRRAVDVHRPVQLHLHPLVVLRPAVEHLAAEVAQADLHVDDAADGVREEEKAQSLARRQPRDQSAEPGEVEAHDANLQRAPLVLDLLARQQEDETLRVQVEPRHSHDGVERVVLRRDEKPRRPVKRHSPLMVQGPHRVEVLGRHRQHGHVLNVRVALQRVARAVVHVVRRRPPRDADAVAQVTDDQADEKILGVVVRDGAVPGVVPDEHRLLPEHAQQHGAQHVRPNAVPRANHAPHRGREERGEAREEFKVVAVIRAELTLEVRDEGAERGDVGRDRVGGCRGPDGIPRRGREVVLRGLALRSRARRRRTGADEISNLVRVQSLRRLAVRRVVRAEGVRHVPSRVLHQRDGPAGVTRDPLRDVVHAVADDDPSVVLGAVTRDVVGGVAVVRLMSRGRVHVRVHVGGGVRCLGGLCRGARDGGHGGIRGRGGGRRRRLNSPSFGRILDSRDDDAREARMDSGSTRVGRTGGGGVA